MTTDAEGSVYVAGSTVSLNSPVTNGAFQPKHAGMASSASFFYQQITDAFVSKFDSKDNLVCSTYLGGSSTRHSNRHCR